MIENKKQIFIKIITFFIIAILCYSLIFHAQAVANSIKDGIITLIDRLIPTLFPFMVLSSYISNYSFSFKPQGLTTKICDLLFKSSPYCALPFFLGILGGYPVGALIISDLHNKKTITKNETERLFYWCINPSPAFTVTAIGTFMLGSTSIGIILYLSCILASLTLGILCRFLSETEKTQKTLNKKEIPQAEKLINAVANGSHAMLGICGWVLTFCALNATFESLVQNKTACLLFSALSEVTIGCKVLTESPLPLISIAALLGFGGFAVICQICVYANNCNIQIKRFICSRLINSAFSALYCSFLLKLFPQTENVFVTITAANTTFNLYHNVFATVILILMCILLILEVDNQRKIC